MISSEELQKEMSQFIGTEAYHKLGFGRIVATDGVKGFCEKAEAFSAAPSFWRIRQPERHCRSIRTPAGKDCGHHQPVPFSRLIMTS